MRFRYLALALGAVCAAPLARAESPRLGSFEIGAGNYTPSIDDDFPVTGVPPPGPPGVGPYEGMFGSGRGWMFRLAAAKALLTGVGSLEAGVQTGFFRRSARAFVDTNETSGGAPNWQRSGDTTTFNVIPTSLTLTYRLDWLAENYPVPLAPYARASLERYNWWVSDSDGMRETGATNGYSVTGGLAILLDFFDRGLARELDADTGVNHTYLYVDVTKSFVSDFGSDESWDLSGKELMLSGGLLFAF